MCSTWKSPPYRAGEPTSKNRRVDSGILIGSSQDQSAFLRSRSTSASPNQRTILPWWPNEVLDQSSNPSNIPRARAVTKSNGCDEPSKSSIRPRNRDTFERPSERITSAWKVDFFRLDSIETTFEDEFTILIGMDGNPGPEPTSASRPSRMGTAEVAKILSPK